MYLFPTAKRAPPEGHLAYGYEGYVYFQNIKAFYLYISVAGHTQIKHTANMLLLYVLTARIQPRLHPFQDPVLLMLVSKL